MNKDFQITSSIRKVRRLNEHLENRFGISLTFESIDYLVLVEKHYRANRDHIISLYGLAESLKREDYAKAVMISETIGMFLREIAPSRLKPRTRKERK